RQAGLMKTLLPQLAVDLSDPLAGWSGPAWLEIGFGGGEHMAAQAAKFAQEGAPEVRILGAEPFVNGVASAVRHVEEQGLSNVRIHHGDARDLISALPDGSIERVFILFPDPWPKARHHKRRIVQPELLTELARVLKPGGGLRFATDWAEYADWTLERVLKSGLYAWPAERADDWRRPPADHVTTRYEQKRLGDCAPVFLDFVRR
ncbi:MAG: tRNA (guanosine(46)-N7)-methyltransferase TrmB, partial [Caulobacteraceae bacterium]